MPTTFLVIPGAGSAGLAWKEAAYRLRASVLPVPDEPDVRAMATALGPQVERQPRGRVLVGSSLGALVALEIVRSVAVDALVLVAAGFGISVSRRVLSTVRENPPRLFEQMARGVVADSSNQSMVELIARDFASRGQPTLLRHMSALRRHRPEPPTNLPPTTVLWGTADPGVSVEDHIQLALRCRAPVVPIPDTGHLPYLERPAETAEHIRVAATRARLQTHGVMMSMEGP
jgi:pimeloyl-ACP methyl ester carboxylesterase